MQCFISVPLWTLVIMEEFVGQLTGSINASAQVQITMDQCAKQVLNITLCVCLSVLEMSVDHDGDITTLSWRPLVTSWWVGHCASIVESQSGRSNTLPNPQWGSSCHYWFFLTAGDPWSAPDGWDTLYPQLNLNLDDQTLYVLHSGAMHVASQVSGYVFANVFFWELFLNCFSSFIFIL